MRQPQSLSNVFFFFLKGPAPFQTLSDFLTTISCSGKHFPYDVLRILMSVQMQKQETWIEKPSTLISTYISITVDAQCDAIFALYGRKSRVKLEIRSLNCQTLGSVLHSRLFFHLIFIFFLHLTEFSFLFLKISLYCWRAANTTDTLVRDFKRRHTPRLRGDVSLFFQKQRNLGNQQARHVVWQLIEELRGCVRAALRSSFWF